MSLIIRWPLWYQGPRQNVSLVWITNNTNTIAIAINPITIIGSDSSSGNGDSSCSSSSTSSSKSSSSSSWSFSVGGVVDIWKKENTQSFKNMWILHNHKWVKSLVKKMLLCWADHRVAFYFCSVPGFREVTVPYGALTVHNYALWDLFLK